MAISVCNDFFRVFSDGEKIVFLRDSGSERTCIIYENPFLTRLEVNINRSMIDVQMIGGKREFMPGLIDYSVDLSLHGGNILHVDRPLIMGVDIFNRLSVTDYLDIINEKIKRRRT